VFCCSIDRMCDQGDDRKSKRDDDRTEVCENLVAVEVASIVGVGIEVTVTITSGEVSIVCVVIAVSI
jgi:hypothetical protein